MCTKEKPSDEAVFLLKSKVILFTVREQYRKERRRKEIFPNMRKTMKEQALQAGEGIFAQQGREPRGAVPAVEYVMAEFAAEPGIRTTYGRSGNMRVHKS
jgi:hypothetical protein